MNDGDVHFKLDVDTSTASSDSTPAGATPSATQPAATGTAQGTVRDRSILSTKYVIHNEVVDVLDRETQQTEGAFVPVNRPGYDYRSDNVIPIIIHGNGDPTAKVKLVYDTNIRLYRDQAC